MPFADLPNSDPKCAPLSLKRPTSRSIGPLRISANRAVTVKERNIEARSVIPIHLPRRIPPFPRYDGSYYGR